MITLFLMTKKGYQVLASIIETLGPSLVSKVISSQDAAIDKDYYDEIKSLCQEKSIAFFNRTDSFDVSTKYSFAISWRWLINLGAEKELIVFHDSLLPKYRGFAPLVNCLINKEKTIGVTALFAEKEYDKGDIIAQESIAIEYPITIGSAIDKICPLYINLALGVAKSIVNNQSLSIKPQNDEDVSYSLWRDNEDYRINWKDDAESIRRFVDATGMPYAGASTLMEGQLIRILKAEEQADVTIMNRDAGKIIYFTDERPVIVCGKGLLKIVEAHDENGNSIFPLKKFRIRFI